MNGDFKEVPGLEKYMISEEGFVKICATGEDVSRHVTDSGYLATRLYFNGKPRIYRVHRLVAMTYLELPYNHKELLVNHLNGDKLDVSPGNLEWDTSSGNNSHAYETGLNKNGLPFMVYDVTRGVEYQFANTREASMHLPYGREEVYRIIKKSRTSPCDRFVFKAINDDRDWDVVRKDLTPAKIKRYNAYESDIEAKSVTTDETFYFGSISAASSKLKLNRSGIKKRLTEKSMSPLKGWMFKLLCDDTPFPTYTEEEIKLLGNAVGNSKMILVHKKDDPTFEKKMSSISEFVEFLGKPKTYVGNCLVAMRNSGHYHGYTFKEI